MDQSMVGWWRVLKYRLKDKIMEWINQWLDGDKRKGFIQLPPEAEICLIFVFGAQAFSFYNSV